MAVGIEAYLDIGIALLSGLDFDITRQRKQYFERTRRLAIAIDQP